jgi:hypothetical protein
MATIVLGAVLVAGVSFAVIVISSEPKGESNSMPVPRPWTIHSNVRFGLELTVTFASTVLASGQTLTVVAEVNNTLPSEVKLNTTSMTNPVFGPCAQGFATGVEVYAGNYSYMQLFNNGSRPSPLLLYNPSLSYLCPAVFTFMYTFRPNSAIATVQSFLGGSQAGKNESSVVKETSVVKGYWTGSGQYYNFHEFPQGQYTVMVYEGWGQKLIGYFQVV